MTKAMEALKLQGADPLKNELGKKLLSEIFLVDLPEFHKEYMSAYPDHKIVSDFL